MELLLPRVREPARRLPSYVVLDMAFGVGAGSTLFDKSRYRSHGDISGASWATGAHGYALDFNSATPDYVEISADYDQLDFTSEDFSLIMRIKPDVDNLETDLFIRGLYQVDGWRFLFNSSGRLLLQTFQSGVNQPTLENVKSISAGVWSTIGFSRHGASVQLYNGGVAVSQTPGTHIDPATSARSAKIGIYANKSNFPIDGKMEFLRIFRGVALSTSEHLAYHNALA